SASKEWGIGKSFSYAQMLCCPIQKKMTPVSIVVWTSCPPLFMYGRNAHPTILDNLLIIPKLET
ncbi:MAG: hypothetical protein V7L29_12855, partial [Nostoc sp.]|uniref:hypothetical protein n=1 Tax=Nostoc sp. TaxID=1180 RepID=UPI002FF48ADA